MTDSPTARGWHLREHPARGIRSTDRTALDFFEPLTRYDTIEPARVETALARG